jgi:predicted enzyme related to lactoylglutathione lyase
MVQRLLKFTVTLLAASVLLTACAPHDGPGREVALTDAPKFGKFIWHDLMTDDVEAAKAFYGPLLGWTFEDARRPFGGPYTLIVSSTGRYVGGIVSLADPGNGQDYSRWLAYYAVPDVDAAAEAIVKAGGDIVAHARDIGDVARVAAARDPEGAVVGLITSRMGYPVDQLAPAPGDVAWNELVTSSPAGAAAFYADLSGSSVRDEPRGEHVYHMLRNEGRDRAGVMQRPSEDLQPLWLTYFAVNDPTAVASRVADLGGTVLLDPSPDIRDGSIALVTDPTGAVLGLQGKR